MKPVIFLSPHRGVLDFIWGDTRGENAFKGFAGLVQTDSLGLSDNLVRKFEAWVNEWHENFVRHDDVAGVLVPVWSEGFDSVTWRSDGVALMGSLQEERPDLDVRNGFDSDVYATNRTSHEPESD